MDLGALLAILSIGLALAAWLTWRHAAFDVASRQALLLAAMALVGGALALDPASLAGLHVRVVVAQGDVARLTNMPGLVEQLGPRSRVALAEAAREIGELEQRVREVERSLEATARQSDVVIRLRTIPGVGLLTATALLAFVGDVRRFPSGRHFASYLGLTPRESSSGLRRRLGAISKRGDPYLRMLLIHGARSVLLHAKRTTGQRDRLRHWALDRERARGHNKAAVALANKMARLVWAVWRHGQPFGPLPAPEAA